MERIRRGLSPVLLAAVVAVSTYWIVYGSNPGLNIAGAIILALSLFSVRKHYRVSYGAIEIGFSIFVLTYNCLPGTWVTVYNGDTGNIFGPRGLSRGSSLHASWSK